jgi:serine/threonine protein kinase
MSEANQQTESLFSAALAIESPEERAKYLDQVCGSDQSLRARVDELLAAYPRVERFLEAPAAPGITTDQARLGESPGTLIGPYKLVQEIGAGGMGTVWMAQQTEPVKRLVALKVIKPGMDSHQVLARFEAERQALALMDHPNIARVLDAGATAAGRPYFVMELVKGVPLTKYCDEHRLTPKERLALFIPVCLAIQHAHQKGIIHRDIKPSNVLVALYDGKPVPKVIDFGVAKATGQQLTEHTLVTGFGAVVGTLEYMSPEQAELNQLDIDTRSDIYSLGVLLYELLTGSTPLEKKRLHQAAMLEVLRIIREEEPPRPSTRLSSTDELPSVAANRGLEPRKLSGVVRGELDWIVMKAIEKDRNRRYETANGFAMDVQRYLADEPVLACPPSAGYRLRKFARRHKGGLAAAGLVLAVLMLLGGGLGWVARDREARQLAVKHKVEQALAEAQTFCRRDRLAEAAEAVKRAEALLASAGSGGDSAGRVAQARTDVAMAARVEAIRLEGTAVKDDNFDRPREVLQYAEAFRDYGLDVGQLEPDEAAAAIDGSAIREQLVAALDNWLVAASGRDRERERERLLAVLVRADTDLWRKQLRVAFVAGNVTAIRELARQPNAPAQPSSTVILMGKALSDLGENALAVEVLRQVHQEHPGDFWLNQYLGCALLNLKSARAGEAVKHKGQVDEAIAAYREALRLKPDYAETHCNLGLLLQQKGEFGAALEELRRGHELGSRNPRWSYPSARWVQECERLIELKK